MSKSQEQNDMEALAREFLRRAFKGPCSIFLSGDKLIVKIVRPKIVKSGSFRGNPGIGSDGFRRPDD